MKVTTCSEFEKDLEKIQHNESESLNEGLASKSIEDIMADGFSREIATAIYEAEHHINMGEPVEAHEYLARFRRMRSELNKK